MHNCIEGASQEPEVCNLLILLKEWARKFEAPCTKNIVEGV